MTRSTTSSKTDLIVIGASARAACFSAARAGFSPYWIDQFGDSDLRAAFPGRVVPAGAYPAGLVAALGQAPMAPVIYTGALENHPRVLERIAGARQLLGNNAALCARLRDPAQLRARLSGHGINYPRIFGVGAMAPAVGLWLHKPERSGGGLGIAVAHAGTHAAAAHYLQEFVSGESFSAVYVASDAGVQMLGITQQLVGEADFHAPAFSYCGSIGPVTPVPQVTAQWEKIGQVLAAEFGLRGLFGVDGVVCDGTLTVIEVNPRYTASVEVLEAALGVAAVALHMSAWNEFKVGQLKPALQVAVGPVSIHGKAVLFAPMDLVFNNTAAEWIRGEAGVTFADLPAPGTPVGRGAPILTLLCSAVSPVVCVNTLRRAAAGVYQALGMAG